LLERLKLSPLAREGISTLETTQALIAICKRVKSSVKEPLFQGTYEAELQLMSEHDENLKWIMEQQVNSYLTWIGLWLVCLLGNVSILTAVASVGAVPVTTSRWILFFFMCGGLLVGMIFSVYRVNNILEEHIRLVIQIEDKTLRRNILEHRGKLSTFAVDNQGRICRVNLLLAYALHVVVFFVLFYLAL
jgi:hypothetical protein